MDDRENIGRGKRAMKNRRHFVAAALAAAAMVFAAGAGAQDVRHYRFAHDQQLNSGYSIAYDIFSAKLKELSKGTMLVDQYPGAQLGQESQILQLVRSGDNDNTKKTTTKTTTNTPQTNKKTQHNQKHNEDHI